MFLFSKFKKVMTSGPKSEAMNSHYRSMLNLARVIPDSFREPANQ